MLTESPLGKASAYLSEYAPHLLFPIPRALARESVGFSAPLPFRGADMWTGFELSWLNLKGKPHVCMLDIHIPCTSLNIIESKSLKLYLNSLNQSRYSSTQEVCHIIERDLSQCAGADVTVTLIPLETYIGRKLGTFTGDCLDDLDVETNTYEVEPKFLTVGKRQVNESLYTHLLKSNCRGTGQPDWATLLIRYQGPQIDHAGLLKYVISYRNHTGFHEECVERMFWDLTQRCEPDCLTVYARYTRRGGLDINPFRSNFESVPPNERHLRQ